MTSPRLARTIQTPSPISSLAFGTSGHVFAGSDDGSLRVYYPSGCKVLKAIRGLGSEISSIVSISTNETELGAIWLASGRRILSFHMDSKKLVSTLSDATVTLDLDTDESDALNELALSYNRKYLAFSLDTGVIGIVDLDTKKVSTMKTKHSSICGTVKFIPGRPSELVSGGYDQEILHFDFMQRSLVSRRNLAALPAVGGMTMSPPFVMSTSISSASVMAAGTADGRLYLGFGGQPPSSGHGKKKTRQWGGLRASDELMISVAEGPIVAMAFSGPNTLIISTLLGKTTQYHVFQEEARRASPPEQEWSMNTKMVSKVNAMVVNERWIIIGGLCKEGKGVIEVWDRVTDVNVIE